MAQSIEQRASFELIRYANCWEDADILCEALAPAEGKRFVSIASGGDNSFALLAEGAEVVAADLSRSQLSLVELKVAAIAKLEREETLRFLGIHEDRNRLRTFERLREQLSAEARTFWEGHQAEVQSGVIHHGKFENYFRLFRTRVLPWVHGKRRVASLLEARDPAGRHLFYEREWNTWRWRLLFRIFFSRYVMGRLGRDPEFFRFVKGSVAERILERARYALTTLAPAENPYLEYILTGNYGKNLPRYLRSENYLAVRAGLDRLTLYHGAVDEAANAHRGDGFDGFNLSDIFEYLAPEICDRVYGALLDASSPGARFAYWNMLAPRSCPESHLERVRSLTGTSRRLYARDMAFFYSAFLVEEVSA